jgi:excisionase family DNA binding protein
MAEEPKIRDPSEILNNSGIDPQPPTRERAEQPEILTAEEVAAFLRVPLLTVQRQAKAGRLPGRRIGKQWRFSRSVLLEWIAAGPDRHDLEIFSRKNEQGDETGSGDLEDMESEVE